MGKSLLRRWGCIEMGMRAIDEIIIHCTATPNGRWNTVEDIDLWHRDRGFKRDAKLIGNNSPMLTSIGYHYVIYTTGVVRTGRGEREMGAHCKGHNVNSLGVALVGTDQFSLSQWASLKANIESLLARYPNATVHGHREFAQKECPGFDVQRWLSGGMGRLEGHVYGLAAGQN